MSLNLYSASVPVFLRYLDRLTGLLDAAQAHGDRQGQPADALLCARLAPDMADFAAQVMMAAGFALRACFPLAGQAVPPDGGFAPTLDGLRQRIAAVKGLIGALQPHQFQGGNARLLQSKAGLQQVSLPAELFLLQYALPNFFFHLSVAYSILRSRGVRVGKADFDGFHVYAT